MKTITAFRIAVIAVACTIAATSKAADLTDMVPDYVSPEFEHISHVSQHFTANHTNYGANIASIVLHWDLPKGFTLEIAEGLDLDRHYRDINSFGEIIGPREQFTARIGYRFALK